MSLILEALKKVERERTTPEQRGFLVLGPAAWTTSRSNVGWIFGMVAAAAIAGAAVYLLTRPAPGAGPEVTRSEAVAPVPAAPPLVEPGIAPANTDWEPTPQSNAPRARRAAPVGARTLPDRAPAAPALRLHAISEQDGVPVAVVNERVVRVGDTFDGVRVLRIGTAEVEVEVAGARRVLRF